MFLGPKIPNIYICHEHGGVGRSPTWGKFTHFPGFFLGGVSLTKKFCDWLVGGFLFGTEYGGEGVCSGTNHPVHKLTSFFGHVCKKNIQYWRNGRGEVGLCGK